MGLLDGKVAIITGGANGIGRSHCLAFAKEGAKVVVNDLGGDRSGGGGGKMAADTVVDEIKKAGGAAAPSYDNVATVEGGQNILKSALSAFGKVDILVNNAGILRDKSLAKMSEAEWDAVIAVHLKGTFCVTQPVFTWMKENGKGGRIINTTSVSGLMGNFGQANYSSAKAGIYGFTRTVSMEGMKYAITVNAIAPAALTRMTSDLAMFQGVSEEELGPQHITPIVLFLASDLSADITGKIFGTQGRHLFEYKMAVSNGVRKDSGIWSAPEIQQNIKKIMME
ncbi:MAG: SDR family NAD(P)-dependent oxidoreductase [Nitrospirae bacterium]|nr:SDR family NAD(P)-dependent oxidoreductase [Nitrospirota bacterium]